MSRYRVERDGGVFDTELGEILRKSDSGWARYKAWLDAGNDPDPPEQAPGPSLDERRDKVRARVNDVRERALGLGVAWGGYLWDADPRSQANLTGAVAAVLAGMPLPEGFTWRTADNQDVPMLAAGIVELGAAMLAFANSCYARSWQLKAALAVSEDPEAVDLFTGWPTPFAAEQPELHPRP